MPPNPRIDQRNPRRLDLFAQLNVLLPSTPPGNEIQHGQAIDEDKIRSHLVSNFLHNLYGESNSIGKRSAPLVGSLIGTGSNKLVNQIAFRAHDFDTIVA